MPTIAVNLGNVEAFESLPFGKYLGEIEKVTYKEPREAGKFAQLQVTYLVIDGEHTGRKQSEWLSLSPKAAFRLKRYFNRFGLGDTENFDVDDDTDELLEPDLAGFRVIFEVKPDGDRIRTELVSVEDEAPAPQPIVRRPAAPAAPKPVPAKAEAEADEELEEIEEAEEAPAPPARPARPAPVAPARQAPQRRTLR